MQLSGPAAGLGREPLPPRDVLLLRPVLGEHQRLALDLRIPCRALQHGRVVLPRAVHPSASFLLFRRTARRMFLHGGDDAAGLAIAQQFGRAHTPQDQAWIETLFGHVKGEWPHLEKIRGPGEPGTELDRVRTQYNTVRLHASIGYVSPDDEARRQR